MSVIMDALAKLDIAVGKLDSNMHGVEQKMAGQQHDMFVSPSNENAGDAAHTIDGAVIAQRLDQAIEKVETILGESEEERANG